MSLTATSVPVSCFGGSNGQINVTSSSGGTGSISYSLNGVSYQSGTNFPGLVAGTYTVYAKDIAGCIKSILVIVTQPTMLMASVTTTNAACNGYSDGIISIVGSGGTPPYVYEIADDGEYQNIGYFSNLAAGTYALAVIDANGCEYDTTGTITQPTAVAISVTTTNSTCGNSNGGFLATATGGSGSGYTYSLNGGSFGSGSFSSMAAGTYVVTAKDGTGCSSVIHVTIFDSNGPSIVSSSYTNVKCNGGNDGTITINSVAGGTGTLQYSVNGISYQLSPVFNGLMAGHYNVIVKDAVGCIGSIATTLTEPNAFVITKTVTNVICNASHTGSVALLVGGGAGTLAYSVNGGATYQSSNMFTGLAAGTYDFTVRDAGSCLAHSSATVNQPPAIIAYYSSLNVTCHGAHNGALNVYAWGGTGVLHYSLDGSIYQISTIFPGLSGGEYTIFVKDVNACVATITASVYEPATLAVGVAISNVTCAGGNDGVIDLSVSGGSPHYYFNWSNDKTSEDNFNLAAGTYVVVLSDANGCASTMSFSVSEPATPVIVNGTVVNSTAANNGAIDITTTGGVGSYTFLWSNGATTEDVSGLSPGVYSVVVTDGNGCAASSTFIVTSTLGIASIDVVNEQISVYPNPASNYVIVEANGFRIDKVEVFDILGQLLFSNESKTSKVEINTSGLNQGVYFVKILVDEKLITKKMRITK